MNENPFLKPLSLPHSAVPFDQIKPEHFIPALKAHVAEARQKLVSLKLAPASFSNTLEGLESLTEKIDWTAGIFFNLLGAETNEKLQALAQEVGPLLAEFSSDVSLDPELFKKIKEVYDQRTQLKLNAEQTRLLENTYTEFVRNGALLDQTKQEQLRALDQRLSQLAPKFSEHVLKATNAFEMYLKSPEEIDGLPEGYLEAAKAAAEAKGHPGEYLVTLQFPSYMPFMKFATHRPSREKLARAFGMRAYNGEFDNQKLIMEMIKLRFDRANLLGYKNHAEFVLERRMAEAPAKVMGFLEKLLKVARPAADKELAELQAYAKKLGGPDQLQSWDYNFYSEKLKEERYSYNEEELRPYFKLENVVSGVFEVAKRLFKLEFTPSKKYPVFHPEVEVYEVHQQQPSGRTFMGLFYTDFFPRASKRDGAWMANYLDQGQFQGEVRRPHVSITCNFTKPTATKPSLLTLVEVKTLFHEFGHALHSLLSNCHYRSLAGTNVYWDFVELPSQVLENWTVEKEALDLFARHYQTGQPMPIELIEKVRASEQFLSGTMSVRQLNFAFLDMGWYNQDPSTIHDVSEHENKITERTTTLPKIPGTNSSCAFGHIFGGGYSAGYYSYKWAEVLDADAFEYFKERGIFNPEVAQAFEQNILSRGGSEHPSELYRRFRGREPDPNALLRREGLLEAEAQQ
ncbi:MAG: M3 family metallopeptidase [Bdellovibrionales bacterium]